MRKQTGTISPVPLSDEELLEHVCNQEEAAAVTLFHRYNKLAFSLGCRILRDEGEAEDLVQEIFLRLCSEAGSFDKRKGSARTWIVQMIYRRAFDRRAYLHRRQFYSGTDAQEQANAVVAAKSAEEDMIDRLTAQQLKTAFSELSDSQRMTLEMFFFEDLKFTEISERTGEDMHNVRHHYYRGLERLRQLAREMLRTKKTNR